MLGGEGYEAGGGRAFFSASGAEPSWHVETMREGPCRLLEYELGFCDGCNGICVAPNECRPYPIGIDVGPITVSAPLGSWPLTYYGFDYVAIPNPPADMFGSGDLVTAGGGGLGGFGTFEAQALGVTRLDAETITDTQLAMPNGADFTLRWTPADPSARVRLVLASDTHAHGLPSEGIIECEGPDSGSLVVPRDLVEAFPTTNGAPICVSIDCPPSILRRFTRNQVAAGAGDVELVVGSEIQFWIQHTGL